MINKDKINKQSMLTNFLEEELSSKQSKPVLLKSFDKFDFFPRSRSILRFPEMDFTGAKAFSLGSIW